MIRLSATGAALSAAALLVFGGLALQDRADAAAHRRYQRALQRAEELDAQLDAEVARSRLGLVTHFDGLVRLDDLIGANARLLEVPPEGLALQGELARYRAAVEDKRRATERFKTDQAVLRNALRLLPFTADRLASRLPPGDPLREAGTGLVAAVLGASVDSTGDRWATARCALARLGGPAVVGCEPVHVAPAHGPRVAHLVRQAEAVVLRHPAVEQSLRELREAPVADHARALQEGYAVAWEQARARQVRHLGLAAAALALLVLCACLVVIGRLRETASALRKARDREAELALLRSRFVAMASHEFRTPLSIIVSSADLLQARPGGAEAWRDKHVGRVLEAAREMGSLLDRILVVGRADAGLLASKRTLVVVGDLLAAAVSDARASVGEDRRIEVEDRAGPEPRLLDERQLGRHVLGNLLSNALKYSPAHAVVRLRALVQGRSLVFEVCDEGIGIPADELDHLFQPFHRCSNAADFEGTGLGLAMTRACVEAHGGRIEVHSEVGRGTRFVVRVPLEEDDEEGARHRGRTADPRQPPRAPGDGGLRAGGGGEREGGGGGGAAEGARPRAVRHHDAGDGRLPGAGPAA